jgi:hypothetical protein
VSGAGDRDHGPGETFINSSITLYLFIKSIFPPSAVMSIDSTGTSAGFPDHLKLGLNFKRDLKIPGRPAP